MSFNKELFDDDDDDDEGKIYAYSFDTASTIIYMPAPDKYATGRTRHDICDVIPMQHQ